jgi:uncharacterized protein with HEPN domain
MRRNHLLLGEMLDAADRIQELVAGVTVNEVASDRQRRDAPLWNFTVLGEAAAQISEDLSR